MGFLKYFSLLMLALTIMACGAPPKTPANTEPYSESVEVQPEDMLKTYQVRGIVIEIPEDSEHSLSIKHEAIPGFMEAMTMTLRLEDASQREMVQVGAEISFEMVVSENDAFIRLVEVLKQGTGQVPASKKIRPLTAAQGEDLEVVNLGEMVPEITLFQAKDEKLVNLSDFRGRYVLISFMFTTCPYPTACPLMAKNMAKIQEASKSLDPALHQLSITIDPDNDTAQVLRNYGKQYKADPDRWNFLYSDEKTIAHAAYQLDVDWYWGDNTLVHKLVSSLVAPDGTLIAKYGSPESWDHEAILMDIQSHKTEAKKP